MSLDTSTEGSCQQWPAKEDWAYIALGILIAALSISNSSLWIDEGFSAMLAAEPTLGAWGHTLNMQAGSDSQMPGYYLYLWIWSRLFGFTGLAIRLANLPWIVFFIGSLAWASKNLLDVRMAWLVVCLSPFLGLYVNEARPYLLIMALSMATVAALLASLRDECRFGWLPWLVTALVLALWFVHMLAITLIPSLILLAFLVLPNLPSVGLMVKAWRRPVLALLPFYALLAAYYTFTIARGRGGQRDSPGPANFAFALYEFAGLDGLGPPRNLLRTAGIRSVTPYLGWLGFGILALCIVAWLVLSQWKQSNKLKLNVALLSSLTFGLIVTLTLSYVAHFRLLGRHVAVFFPLFALLLLSGLLSNSRRGTRAASTVALLLLATAWGISTGRERLMAKYQKDDYRDAVAIALAAQRDGYEVLWLADPVTAKYYGLPTKEVIQPSGQSELLTDAGPTSCTPGRLQTDLNQHKKILAVITDREFYDKTGQCRRMVQSAAGRHVASLVAFEIWRINEH